MRGRAPRLRTRAARAISVALVGSRATFPRGRRSAANCLHPRTWQDLGATWAGRFLSRAAARGDCRFRHPVRRPAGASPRLSSAAGPALHLTLRARRLAPGPRAGRRGRLLSGRDRDRHSIAERGIACGPPPASLSARLIFGADGRNSLVARHAGLMPPARAAVIVLPGRPRSRPPAQLDHHVYLQVFEAGYYGYCRFDAEAQAVVSLVLDARLSADPADGGAPVPAACAGAGLAAA